MSRLKLYDELTPEQIAFVFASQRHSPGWERGYSLKNDRSTDDAVARAMNGEYAVKVSHINHDPVDAHWLKRRNYAEHYAWIDGIVFAPYRGEHYIQIAAFDLFERWAARQGFQTLLCAVFTDNQAAVRWTEERCSFARVGTRSQASPRPDGTWGDVHVYVKHAEHLTPTEYMSRATQWADEALAGFWLEDYLHARPIVGWR